MSVWGAAYLLTLALGCYFGFETALFPMALVLFVPPVIMHVKACLRVMRRTKLNHPNEWKLVGHGINLNFFLSDTRDFGDVDIANDKRELRWWLKVGVVCGLLHIPTMMVLSSFAKIVAE